MTALKELKTLTESHKRRAEEILRQDGTPAQKQSDSINATQQMLVANAYNNAARIVWSFRVRYWGIAALAACFLIALTISLLTN